MTKILSVRKVAASLLAAILFCQVFMLCMAQMPVHAGEAKSKMKFEIWGEGEVSVTDVDDHIRQIDSGAEIAVPDGKYIRVHANASEDTRITVRVVSEDMNYDLEDTSEVWGKYFWRDVTAAGMRKKIVITFGKDNPSANIQSTRNVQTHGSKEKPEAGDVFTGTCVVTAVDGGNGHTVHGVTISGFTGILAGMTVEGKCADHTAAAPYPGQEFTYEYTVTSVNKITGEVYGNLYCKSVVGATDGVTKDDAGRLIGYQRLNGITLIYRNYGGYAKLKKGKSQTTLTDNNPEYSLEGACYGVYYDAGTAKEAATFTTDKEGNSNTVELEEGTYYVKEKKAPKGYRLDEKIYPVVITSGETAEINVTDEPLYSDMELVLEKIDLESKSGNAQGAGSLEGAEFTVRYYAGSYEKNTLPETPDKTWILSTKKEKNIYNSKLNKEYQTAGDTFYYAGDGTTPVLPLGTICIEETKAPKGYLLESAYIEGEEGKIDGTYYLTQIKQDGTQVKIQGGNRYKIADRICRGDIEFQKKDEETQAAMAEIPFEITSVTTGESHRIMTDENGYFSSASNYVKHSVNTNTGQAESGVWFGMDSNGETVEVNDAYGAFPYDTYRLEELRCESNMDKSLYKGTFKISRDQYTVDLGTIMNPDLTLTTSAKDGETGTHYANADKNVSVTDTVTYTGLKKGQEYVMKGTLMDQETGEAFLDQEGKKITVSQPFKPKTAEGNVEIEFVFDGRPLAGKSITIFEECFMGNELIAVHKDLNDTNQMIHFPKLKTSVKDEQTESNMIKAEKNMIITDTVEYHNLKKGKQYKITGTLMDQETGKAVKDASGEKVTSDVEFTAKEKDGTVEVKFIFNGTNLRGKTLVAFEHLYYGEKLYAVHADLEDEEQTMYVPALETVALARDTGTHHAFAGGITEFTDTVTYRNLQPGKNYTLHGMMVEKETKEPLCDETQLEFVPEETDGTVEMTFEINGDVLAGKTIVAYEEVKIDGKSIAEHKDPESKEQSIYFPKITTKALDEASKTQEAEAKKDQKITDRVSYENLLPGKTYVLKGVVMNKKSGKELLDKNDHKIICRTTFIPETAGGTVEMTFELDAQELDGTSVVVFERLYDEEGYLIAKEENIDNTDQTITYKKPETPQKSGNDSPGRSSSVRKSPKTGDELPLLWVILLLGSLGILITAGIRIYKKKHI